MLLIWVLTMSALLSIAASNTTPTSMNPTQAASPVGATSPAVAPPRGTIGDGNAFAARAYVVPRALADHTLFEWPVKTRLAISHQAWNDGTTAATAWQASAAVGSQLLSWDLMAEPGLVADIGRFSVANIVSISMYVPPVAADVDIYYGLAGRTRAGGTALNNCYCVDYMLSVDAAKFTWRSGVHVPSVAEGPLAFPARAIGTSLFGNGAGLDDPFVVFGIMPLPGSTAWPDGIAYAVLTVNLLVGGVGRLGDGIVVRRAP